MFTRLLPRPEKSVLLLGPRGTGKSTWIRQKFNDISCHYDLLNTREALRLSKSPELLYEETAHFPPGSWVVIDEVQKVPALLDEVHRLIEEKNLRFVLSGSSARKLKRGSANLLAGRARNRILYPLVSAEVNFEIEVVRQCTTGMLPMAYLAADSVDYLRTYTETYLQEEIKGEALTRNIGAFARFLEIAARQNGQVTNLSNIGRDAMVGRQTVQGYFEILTDTLIGTWLYPWKLKRATKQVTHPKFYFFDSGVARALSGRLPYPPTPEELGPLLETFILGELRAYLYYTDRHYPLHFWKSYDNVEVDFLCETKAGYAAIEIKLATHWESKFNRGLVRLQEELNPATLQCIGVYTGQREWVHDKIRVLPVLHFLKALWAGELIA